MGKISLIVGSLMGVIILIGLLTMPILAFAEGPVFDVVSPVGISTIQVKPLAPSLKTLEGKTICELWNYMFYGDVTFPKIEEVMLKRYPGIKFISYKDLPRIHGPDEKAEIAALKALPDALKKYRCDAVISGNGG
jgi:hypothetical protein